MQINAHASEIHGSTERSRAALGHYTLAAAAAAARGLNYVIFLRISLSLSGDALAKLIAGPDLWRVH